MAVRIDGKAVAAKVRGEIAEEVAALKKQGVQTGMAVVLVGEDPASKIYVRNKGKACAETGIYSEEHVLPENTTQEELLALIEKLNADPKINGILVQSPLPKHLNEALIVEHIDPKKDVDAFHAENVGRIMIGDFAFLPCTPAGIIELIRSTGVTIDGKNKLCGDVDYESAEAVAGYLTPVPGGVGPMTITMLMKNAVTAAKIQNGLV